MARNDRSGEVPTQVEWREIERALQLARRFAQTTAQALQSLRSQQIRAHVSRQPDPRLARGPTPGQATILSLLRIHFKLQTPDPQEVMNLAEAYGRIHRKLAGLTRQSFRLVTDVVARAGAGSGGGDTFGYVIPGQPNTIYLNETYFSMQTESGGAASAQRSSSPAPTSGRVRGLVQPDHAGMRVQHSLNERAGVILHETVHLVYGADGAVHRALRNRERVDTDTVTCHAGFPQITSYRAAMNEAYVYTRFARCVVRSRAAGSAASAPR
jgi:hypothetical protein